MFSKDTIFGYKYNVHIHHRRARRTPSRFFFFFVLQFLNWKKYLCKTKPTESEWFPKMPKISLLQKYDYFHAVSLSIDRIKLAHLFIFLSTLYLYALKMAHSLTKLLTIQYFKNIFTNMMCVCVFYTWNVFYKNYTRHQYYSFLSYKTPVAIHHNGVHQIEALNGEFFAKLSRNICSKNKAKWKFNFTRVKLVVSNVEVWAMTMNSFHAQSEIKASKWEPFIYFVEFWNKAR